MSGEEMTPPHQRMTPDRFVDWMLDLLEEYAGIDGPVSFGGTTEGRIAQSLKDLIKNRKQKTRGK
jgi:hypothetical protein